MNKEKIGQLLLKRGKDLEWIKQNMVIKKDHQEVMSALRGLLRIYIKKDLV